MNVKSLITKARSIRRFDQGVPVPAALLEEFVDVARVTPSSANRQPLKFVTVSSETGCASVFPTLSWAGRLKEWPGPDEGERPAAYIVIVLDTTIAPESGGDQSIAGLAIQLAAAEAGFGACMIGSIKRESLAKALELDDRYRILLVVALGKPSESIVLEPCEPGADPAYYRDADGRHHVPKRSLAEVLLAHR